MDLLSQLSIVDQGRDRKWSQRQAGRTAQLRASELAGSSPAGCVLTGPFIGVREKESM